MVCRWSLDAKSTMSKLERSCNLSSRAIKLCSFAETMKLSSLLTESQIILEMRASQHDEAIEELVDHLKSSNFLANTDKIEIISSLKEREDQVSTGIGSGVAIPHIFSDSVDEVVAIFGRSKVGIDFEAMDNAPVELIVMFIVPKEDYHKHLQTLSAIARLFTNCEVRKQLVAAESKEEILNIFASRPSRVDVER